MKEAPRHSLSKRNSPKDEDDGLVSVSDIIGALRKIPGGYVYSGACSYQLCFPLKEGGELRFSLVDDDMRVNPEEALSIDLYGAEIPGGVTGPAFPTGEDGTK